MASATEARQQVCAALDRLAIHYTCHEHTAVARCEQAAAVIGKIPGRPAKSLLLKSPAKTYCLVILPCANG